MTSRPSSVVAASRIAASIALAATLVAASAAATDYCVDPVTGDDTASGRCADRAWRTLGPSQSFAFVTGDRILLSAGRHVHPLTQWYMKPGVSWIGAGRDRTTVVFDKAVSVPFVRFRTGSGGSGPPSDLRPDPFTNATLLADMTILNEGQAHTGIDVVSTSGDSAPAIARVAVVGFATGVSFHPASDERVAASTHVRLTNSIIRDASDAGLAFFADVFYPRAVTEGSTVINVAAQSDGVGAVAKTQLQDLRDAANAAASPVLTNLTLSGAGEAALLLVSYYDDGTGLRRVTQNAGATAVNLRGSILTGASGHGVREHSSFTEPAAVTDCSLGGNATGDYLDEGTTLRPAPSVGTGNLSLVPLFVDQASGDLHVLAASPTLDRLTSGAPADDVDSHGRPQGARSEMGADEWVACAAIADTSASRTPAPCTGGSATLDSAGSSVDSACAAGLRIEWYRDTTLIGTTPTLDVSPPTPTTYRLRVGCNDPALSACFDEATVDVEPSSPPPSADAGTDQVACALPGDAVVFSLSGMASATPPSALTGTLWTSTSGIVADPTALVTTLTVTAAPGGNVVTATLRAADDASCTHADDVVLLVHPMPTVEVTAPAIECHDPGAASVQVALVADTSGGTGSIGHAWTSSEGVIGGDASALLTLGPSTTARTVDVTVVVTDDEGCTATDVATVRVVPNPVADAGADGQACGDQGSTVAAPLDGSASLGEPPLTFRWSAAEGTIGDAAAAVTSIDLSVNATPRPVTVTLEVSDATGTCRSSDTRVITVGPGPTALAGADTSACASPGVATFPLDGTASAGVPPLTYAWSASAGTIADPTAPSTSIDVNVGGTTQAVVVTLEVGDARGTCTATDQRIITVGPGPVAVAGADTVSCARSGRVTVDLDGTASTGEPPLAYRWTVTTGTLADPASAATTLTVDLDDVSVVVTATLEVTDARGTCRGTDARAIRLAPLPLAEAGGPYAALQGGGPTRMTLDAATIAGEAPLVLLWTTDLGAFEDTGATTSTLAAPVLVVPNQPSVQRGQACLTVRTPADCTAGPTCADVTVLLTPVSPPNDVSPTLRVTKSPPVHVELSWQEALVDAGHDAATTYDVLASEVPCGPFPRLMRVTAAPGTNGALDPVLATAPAFRCYVVRSLNDGGGSLPSAPDGTLCR